MEKNSSLQRDTEAHYNSHPFEFLTKEDEDNIEVMQPYPFIYFAKKYVTPTDKIIDMGCGGGRATLYLKRLGLHPFAFDLSMQSLKLARSRCQIGSYVCGTNLSLPFANAIFDVVVSDGVIHHTPNAQQSLKENSRVLKENGYLYLAVYKKEGYYFYVYRYLGKPVRWLSKYKWGKYVVTYTLGLLYYFIHLLRKKGLKTWKGAKNFFYDYIITPQASFFSKQEIEALGEMNHLEKIHYDNSVGNVHIVIFKKRKKA